MADAVALRAGWRVRTSRRSPARPPARCRRRRPWRGGRRLPRLRPRRPSQASWRPWWCGLGQRRAGLVGQPVRRLRRGGGRRAGARPGGGGGGGRRRPPLGRGASRRVAAGRGGRPGRARGRYGHEGGSAWSPPRWPGWLGPRARSTTGPSSCGGPPHPPLGRPGRVERPRGGHAPGGGRAVGAGPRRRRSWPAGPGGGAGRARHRRRAAGPGRPGVRATVLVDGDGFRLSAPGPSRWWWPGTRRRGRPPAATTPTSGAGSTTATRRDRRRGRAGRPGPGGGAVVDGRRRGAGRAGGRPGGCAGPGGGAPAQEALVEAAASVGLIATSAGSGGSIVAVAPPRGARPPRRRGRPWRRPPPARGSPYARSLAPDEDLEADEGLFVARHRGAQLVEAASSSGTGPGLRRRLPPCTPRPHHGRQGVAPHRRRWATACTSSGPVGTWPPRWFDAREGREEGDRGGGSSRGGRVETAMIRGTLPVPATGWRRHRVEHRGTPRRPLVVPEGPVEGPAHHQGRPGLDEMTPGGPGRTAWGGPLPHHPVPPRTSPAGQAGGG